MSNVTAVSGRDVLQTADPSLHHQRWTRHAGAGTGGRQVSNITIIIRCMNVCKIPAFKMHETDRVSRDEFKLKLALLGNQWQGVVRRAQQRRGIIDSLLRQWQRYREMVEKLSKWLVEASHQAETLQAGAPVPLQQARAMLDAVQVSIV